MSVSGDIDLSSVARLRKALQGVAEAAGGDLDVDLSQTSFCDSVGLQALLAGHQQLAAAGRTMRLINPPLPVIRLLQLTATSELFQVAALADHAGEPTE